MSLVEPAGAVATGMVVVPVACVSYTATDMTSLGFNCMIKKSCKAISEKSSLWFPATFKADCVKFVTVVPTVRRI